MGRPQRRPISPVQLWGIAWHPAQHRSVVDPHAALPQEFFDITRAQIPSPGAEDDVGFQVTPCEQGWITHLLSPRICGGYRRAVCIRSPVLLATEPSTPRSHSMTVF